MVRITTEIKNKMIQMRESGATYSEITAALGVTKERCVAYLKDIKLNTQMVSAITKEWKQAELQAVDALDKMMFTDIHNLNAICSTISSWDYLAKRGNKWWLIDVTINGQKSIAAKRDVTVENYEHAILLKTDTEWKLIKIMMETETILKI
jgi:hypothetical protein